MPFTLVEEKETPSEDNLFFKFKKEASNEDLRIVYAEVYIPYRVDTDHETMTKEDVEMAAHNFLASGKVFKIDVQHDLKESGCHVVESFIARAGWEPFIEDAWVMGVKCTPEIWESVKSGDLNGFSFYGSTKKSPLKVLVEVTKQITGSTQKSDENDSPLPPHEHTFIINFANDGSIVSGKTDMVHEHFHVIKHGTATEEEIDHRHRLELE